MRKCIFLILIFGQVYCLLILPTHSFCQKFYLPHKFYGDSTALYRALPNLAKQVVAVYKDSNKTSYYDNAYHYQLLAEDYDKANQFIDSVRKYDEYTPGNKAIAIQAESYIYAKKQTMNDSAPFQPVYQQEFVTLYNKLSDYEKIGTEFNFDTASITTGFKDLLKITDTLKAKNSDSISLQDAQTLTRTYISYIVNRTVIPLARPFLDKTTLKISYPYIKTSRWSGVVPVAGIDEVPDPAMQYKLLMEVVSGIQSRKDSFNINNINGGLSEVARVLNLHIAAGVPKKNIHIVAIVHASAIYSLLNNESYRKKYNVDNPNLRLLKELQDAGIKFIACGQAMYFFNVEKKQMIPGIKISLTAQTVLSSYQLKNYVHYTF